MTNEIDIAYSPCPNDTYIFSGWAQNKITSMCRLNSHLYDVQALNTFALNEQFPITKLSTFCFGKVLDHYSLLPVGAAIGYNCGPKIIAKTDYALKNIPSLKIAFPGKDTTAFLLFVTLFGMPNNPLFCRYDEILDVIEQGKVDVGVIIHETRFTFSTRGYKEICDLGTLFFDKYQCPTPLGVIACSRKISDEKKCEIIKSIKASLDFANKYPEKAMDYVLFKSQEKDVNIVKKHIDLYVTKDTMDLSESGKDAILRLFATARKLHLLPESPDGLHL